MLTDKLFLYMIMIWIVAQNIQASSLNENQIMQQQTWQKPREGWLKYNVDAEFNNSRGTTNRGWCIRDENGNFVGAGTAWYHGIYDSTVAEALALKETIQVAIHMNIECMIYESDSQLLVQAIHAKYGGRSEFSVLDSSIKNLLVLNSNFKVKFVKR
jgi:ribonuclease HI